MQPDINGKTCHKGYLAPTLSFLVGGALGAGLILLLLPRTKAFRLSCVREGPEGVAFEDSLEYELIGRIAEAVNSIERNALKLSDGPRALSVEEQERLLDAIEAAKRFLRSSLDKLKQISKRPPHIL
jgi:hypothetical protein